MFAKIALAKVEIGELRICLFEQSMYPIDGIVLVFYSFPCIGIVLHDFSGTEFSVNVHLPKNDFFLFRGSDGVIFDCLHDLSF